MSTFPDRVIGHGGQYAAEYFNHLASAAATVDGAAIEAAAKLVTSATRNGRRIYSCGNGGSAAIANHLVCDCLKGIRTQGVLRPKVYSLSTTIELITAISNDIGQTEVFSYQLDSLGEPGDLLIAISSSGTSPNIVSAIELAKSRGMNVVSMTGFSGGRSRELADVSLHVSSDNYGMIEDIHQSLMHIIAQYIRHQNLIPSTNLNSIKF